MFPFGYQGESELEYYGLLSPDDPPEETCDWCGDSDEELFEADGLVLCETCYNRKKEETNG